MDIDELDRRYRTLRGWVPPHVVKLLIERGHVDVVRREAEDGDWFCAKELAQELRERGEVDDALRVIRPYVDTAWWIAAAELSELLEGRGDADEAIALVRPYAEAGELLAVERLAELLVGQGHIDDAVSLLRPRVSNFYLARVLVKLTAGHGRDDDVLAIAQAMVDDKQRRIDTHQAQTWNAEPWNAELLLAALLERQGRVDDALQVLYAHAHPGKAYTNGNAVEQYLDVLAGHNREEQLREYASGSGGAEAAFRLATWLEEQGRADEAVAVFQPFVADKSADAATRLAQLLVRHSRVDEAIEVLRQVPVWMGGEYECVVRMLGELMLAHGRVEDALAIIDDLAQRAGGMSYELCLERCWLLHTAGRSEQAIAELRAHPEAGEWYGALGIAAVLADGGRVDEAIEVLSPPEFQNTVLVELLIGQDRVEEAIEVIHRERLGWDGDDPWEDQAAAG